MNKLATKIREFLDTLFPGDRRMENRLIAHLELELSQLRNELAVAQAEVQRCHLAMMPFGTRMGQQYVASLPDEANKLPASNNEAPRAIPKHEMTWAEIQDDHARWMDEEDAKEAAARAAKG